MGLEDLKAQLVLVLHRMERSIHSNFHVYYMVKVGIKTLHAVIHLSTKLRIMFLSYRWTMLHNTMLRLYSKAVDMRDTQSLKCLLL